MFIFIFLQSYSVHYFGTWIVQLLDNIGQDILRDFVEFLLLDLSRFDLELRMFVLKFKKAQVHFASEMLGQSSVLVMYAQISTAHITDPQLLLLKDWRCDNLFQLSFNFVFLVTNHFDL
jgi:hypothetical protein